MWETLLGGKGVSRSAGDVSERVLDALNKAQPEGGTREHGVAFRQREEFLAMRARWREAIAAGEQGLEHLRRALANHPNDAALQHGLLASELQHAIKLGGARRSADAQGAIDEAERLAGKLLADHPRAPVLRADAARIRGMRAEFRHSPGKTDALDEKRRVAPGMQSYTWSATKKLLAERGVELLSAGLDEVPGVKKDINAVMAAQTDHRLPDRGPARAAASSKRLEASPISAPGLAGGQRWVGGCIAFLEGTGGSTSGVQSYSKKPAG
jgi:hypothetical protein